MLAKRITIATITVLFLIAFMSWGTNYIQARIIDSAHPEKAALVKEIDTVNKAVAKIPRRDEQLPLKLAQVEKALEEEGKSLLASMDSTYVINSILELAGSCNVTMTPLQTNDWSMKSDHFMIYTLQIQVEGNYEQTATFISRLENGLFENLVIVGLDISGGLKIGNKPDSANLQLAMYTRR